jgi:hypothetical protein
VTGAELLDVDVEELVSVSPVVVGEGDGATDVGAELVGEGGVWGEITGPGETAGTGALVETSVVGRLNPSSVPLS